MATQSTIHETIEIDRQSFYRRAGNVAAYRAYAEGDQQLKMTQGQKELLENLLEHPYCDNICHEIVATNADRIILQPFKVKTDAEQQFLEDFWVTNRLPALSSEIHYETLLDGNYAVMVDFDNETKQPRIYKEPWWDGRSGVFIAYDAQGDPIYAVKDWWTLDGLRRTIWYEGWIERYLSTTSLGAATMGAAATGGIGGSGSSGSSGSGGSGSGSGSTGAAMFQPFTLPEDDGVWPLQYVHPQTGDAMHIPLVHFANAGRRIINYGKSELTGGVLAHQDHINDLQFDMTGTGRMTGFQMVWMAGVELRKSSKGDPIAPKLGPGKIFHSKDPNAKFGVLEAGSMQSLIDGYTIKLKAAARMTRTPLHVITGGDWPSGEALERAEMPLVDKAARQIEWFRSAWIQVAHRAMEISNAFAGTDLDETEPILAVFVDPSKRNPIADAMEDQAFWTAAKAAADAGVPITTFLRKVAGWTEEDIQQMSRDIMQSNTDQVTISGKTAEAKAHGELKGQIAAKKEAGIDVNPPAPQLPFAQPETQAQNAAETQPPTTPTRKRGTKTTTAA